MATAFYGGDFFGGEFFSSTGGSTPTPTVTTAPPGVKRRRWALSKDGRLHYFDSLAQLRAFDAQSRVIVPPETVKEAKKLGYKTIRLDAERGRDDLLAQIEREIEAKLALERVDAAIAKAQLSARLLDQQDEDDFREFIKFLNS